MSSYKHCFTQQCMDSAVMMCDHESFLTTQYILDQARQYVSQITKCQNSRREVFYPGLVFDQIPNPSCVDMRPISSSKSDNELYIRPCNVPTYNNSLKCDTKQCCSKSHQMFDNHTKARTGRNI